MLSHDGHHLAVTTYGPDPQPGHPPLTVFLAHCWTLNQHDWHYQVRDLQREFGHSIRIITWDHRGHGQSDRVPKRTCTIENLARDWAHLIDELAPEGPLVLAGHSIGGMTMMCLAEERAEIFERVVGAAFVSTSSGNLSSVTLGLPETGTFLRQQIPRILALRSMTLSKGQRRRAPILERLIMRHLVFGMPLRLTDVALAVEGLISCPASTVVGFYEDFMEHDRAHALKVFADIPTHILVGTEDKLTPVPHARKLAEHLPGAAFTRVPGAGHMLPLERDELVSGVLIRLIRPHVAGAAA